MSKSSHTSTPSENERRLASPTLAQLYLEQGHPERAREICTELLARDPSNGYARVLLERLQVEPAAQIEARFVERSAAGIGIGELELRWSVPRALLRGYADARVDLVIAVSVEREGITSALRYTSVRCRELDGVHEFQAPIGPASAAVALVVGSARTRPSVLTHSAHHRPLRFLAVAPPISW